MAAISLRVGEAVRIHGAGGLTLVFRPDGRPWEIEIVPRRDPWWRRWMRAWRDDRQARLLAQLDERILEDIGLGARNSPGCYRCNARAGRANEPGSDAD